MSNTADLPEDLQDPELAGIVAAFQDRENGGQRAPSAAMQGNQSPATDSTPAADDASLDAPPGDSDATTDDAGGGDAGTPPADATPAAPVEYEIGGRRYGADVVEQYVAITERMASLPLEQRQAIDHYVQTGQWPGTQPPSSSPDLNNPPVAAGGEDDFDDDPISRAQRAELEALRVELGEVRAVAEGAASRDAQSDNARVMGLVNSAADAFMTERNLTPADRDALMQSAVDLGVGPAYLERYRGDYTVATRAALETAMYSDPTYRQREIDRLAQAKLDSDSASRAARETRKDKASALAGSATGSVPRDVVAERPKNRQDMIAAMAADIASARSNGISP